MSRTGDQPKAEDRISELKASIGKYLNGAEEPTAEALADVTRAVNELADHVVDLHKRFEKVEASAPQWTIEGWQPPSGDDITGER